MSVGVARRWCAAAGLLGADEGLPEALLRDLYVVQGKSSRQIAVELGVNRARVLQALAGYGIPARDRGAQHRGGGRDAVTDEVLTELQGVQQLTISEIAGRFQVSTSYVARRVRGLGLVRRPGDFGSRTGYDAVELTRLAADLYEEGNTLKQVGQRLGVSPGTVAAVLHKAQVPMRGRRRTPRP